MACYYPFGEDLQKRHSKLQLGAFRANLFSDTAIEAGFFRQTAMIVQFDFACSLFGTTDRRADDLRVLLQQPDSGCELRWITNRLGAHHVFAQNQTIVLCSVKQ